VIATLALCGALAATPPSATETFAVRAADIHLGDGRRLEDGVLLVQAGKIRALGRGVELPEDLAVIEHDGVLAAGMVSCRSYSGSWGEVHDSTRSFLPELDVTHAFDPDHRDFEAALAEGITTVVLAPTGSNVAGGLTAVVKCAGGVVVRPRAHLALSLGANAIRPDREPTSYPGALQRLADHLAAGEGAFGRVAAGELPVLLEVGARHEVERALDFAQVHGLKGALRGAWRAGELADRVAESGLAVVVGPFEPGISAHSVDSVVALADAEVALAFGLDAPLHDPAALRLSAALCVRAGLDRDAAWTALSSGAARIAGVGDRLGRLERGLDADFVLWSGDPLELTSRVEAVFVDGALVSGGVR